jgi:hypothetical protein
VTDRIIEQYGFKGLPFFSDIGGLPAVSVNGYTGLGEGGTLPNLKLSQVIQFADGVSIVHGAHTFKTGADVRFILSDAFTPSGTRGSFSFSGAFTQDPQSALARALAWPTYCSACLPAPVSPLPPSVTCASAIMASISRTTGR